MPPFLITLTRNIKSQEVFNGIAITISSSRERHTELRLALQSA
jgi:hypothetical protein